MVRYVVAIAALAALAWPTLVAADDFKIPASPEHRVTDNAGMLSSSARDSIENTLQTYERTTGHQIIVWIGDTTGGVPLETWTAEAANRWKIGRRGKDDGAILFLFKRDRTIRIEAGYGLESALTDADSHRIIADVIRPRLRNGDADGAVADGVAAILTTVTPSYKGVTPPPETATASESGGVNDLVITLVGLFAIVFIFAIVMQVVRTLRYGYLVLREGPTAARRDMRNWGAWGSGVVIGSALGGGGGFGGGFSGGGFSGGGGSFGGGGASGSW